MKYKSIIKVPLSYLSTTKYIESDTVIKEEDKAYTSGTLAINLNKTLTVKGNLICL